MSWLLITAIPTLLMLSAVGLERIETGLSQRDDANPQFPPNSHADRV
ncbi:hypothetical protein [Mycolicibacter hiberniae]|uniref:Uncharacterized protein n=1 Tax=Mycolicibacter hiberniae TaxID=29314 RepID=A0A7I7X8Y9_9MYCO|nr:hypothetical protein [Mycolicibacter hiberniae]MCV7087677.1 hypothetical protein [Mycolicibacter hiberniae]BBZ24798.1 hypothetical protein MHIB_32160 [Mycolicibacter hiberniae]